MNVAIKQITLPVKSNKSGTKKGKRTKENELRKKVMWCIDIALILFLMWCIDIAFAIDILLRQLYKSFSFY